MMMMGPGPSQFSYGSHFTPPYNRQEDYYNTDEQ